MSFPEGHPVDLETVQQWAGFAATIRAVGDAIATNPIPAAGSIFAGMNESFPPEPISQWAREGIRSAVDHLTVWADHAIPLQQSEGQVVVGLGFRWYSTLIRGAIEGSAQSLWLTGAESRGEATYRLIRMVRHDLMEESKAAKVSGKDTDSIEGRRKHFAEIAEATTEFGPSSERLPSMVDLIRTAATSCGLDPDRYEHRWRTASAAAHGKNWAIRELQVFSGGEEWIPGQFLMTGHLDSDKFTSMMTETVQLVVMATGKFLNWSGLDPEAVMKEAFYRVAERTPLKAGATLEEFAEALEFKPQGS